MSIIISIRPKPFHNILTGKQKWKIFRRKPKVDDMGFPFKVYCCEAGNGGYITAEFDCYDIRPVRNTDEDIKLAAKMACLSEQEVRKIMGNKDVIYALTIDNVKDYAHDEGYEIRHVVEYGFVYPPRNWCYAGVE